MAALVNYSAVLQDADGSNLRFVASQHQFQTWGAGQSATSALSGILATSNQTTVMTVRGSNVGIGTTTPATALHVEGSGIISGNVGIGTTTTPSTSLYVAGDANITGNISAGNLGMFRNRVINGDMRVDQRNAGNAGNSGFGPDRFKVVGSNCATSVLPRRIELAADDVAATGGNFQYATSLSTIAGPTAGLTAYLGFNSNITDVMGGLVNPTVTGTMRYVPGVVASAGTASALYLANEGNVLATPTKASNQLSWTYTVTGPITVSLWTQFTKLPLPTQISTIFEIGTSSTEYMQVLANITSGACTLSSWAGIANTSSVTITLGTWYHVTAVWVPSSTISFYLNGSLIGTTSSSSSTIVNGTIVFGENVTPGLIRPFAGYIDDFRIYNRALGSGEIALLAGLTTGITSAPAGTSLAAYYPFDGSTAESSGNAGPALTTTGSVSYVTGAITGQAVYLANEARVVSSPTQKGLNQLSSGAIFNISGAITMSKWVQFTKLPQSGGYSTVISMGFSIGEHFVIMVTYNSATIGTLTASSSAVSTTGFSVTTGVWYHITGVWVPSSTVTLYVNGSHIGTTAPIAGTVTNGILVIGDSVVSGYNRPFAGYIDDFRIYNRALTSAEIAYLAGNAPYPSIQTFNQAAYFPFDGSLTDSSGNGVTLTPTGTMQYVTGVTGTQALYLANEANVQAVTGVANYCRSLSYVFPNIFTTTFWCATTSLKTSTFSSIWYTNTTGSAVTNSLGIGIDENGKVIVNFNGILRINSTYSAVPGVWFYVTLTYNNGATSLYVNGNLQATGSGTLAQSGFTIGSSFAGAATGFAGYIDDFRIYNTALTQSQISALYYGSAHIANQTTPYLGYVPSSAVLYQQSIEGNNVADLFYGTANAKPATLSLWLKNVTASTQTFTLALNNGGTGGAPRSVLYSIASVAPNAWRRVVVNVPGDLLGTWLKDNGLGLNIALVLGANSGALSGTTGAWQTGAYYTADSSQNYAASATNFLALQDNAVYVTGIQLEKGALVTPFEFRPLPVELQMCQRYYNYIGGNKGQIKIQHYNNLTWVFNYTDMRIAPVITFNGSWTITNGTYYPAFNSTSINQGIIYISSTTVNNTTIDSAGNASNFVSLFSEL